MIYAVVVWAKIHCNIPLGKWFFKFLSKLKWHKIKIGYLAAILKRYNIYLFFPEYGCVEIIEKFRWENGFLRGVPRNPPLGTNGGKSTLVTFKCHLVTLTLESVRSY